MSLNNETTNETSNETLLENSKKLLQDYKIIKQRLTQIITNHILPSDEAIEQALTIGLANRNIIEREVLEAELNEILALIPKDEKIISLILNELDNFDLQSSALEKAVAKSVRRLWIEKRVPQSTRIRFELSAKNEYAGILGLALFDDRNDEFYIKYATIEKTIAPFTTRVILAKGSAKNLAHANGGEFENIPQDYILQENEYEGFLTSSEIYENDGTPQYMYHSLLYSFCKVSNDEPYRHFMAKSPAWFEIELKKMPLSKINFVGDKENSLSNIDNLEIFLENQSKDKTSILDMKSLELRSFEIKNYDYESEESILTKENLSAITNEIIEENLATKNFIDTKSEQNISGKKHFENIHVGGATEETHAANAKYVMDYVKTFFASKIGKLEDLQTNAKDNLVNSINEINSKIDNGGNNTISGANVLIGENKPSVNINPESIG
ncbi:hypothetical protein, partial [Campylobacter sp. US33a]|uniref:hypothetical protein n=1 Tax=Campylobacter sp. US33a TaxID=2498120 RepID=UPI001104EE87